MSNARTGWAAELLVVFASGFLLATVLWMGLFFFRIKPAEAAALRAKESALGEKEVALVNCLTAKDQCDQVKDKIRAENKEIDGKLKQALLGWGRCIRSKTAPAKETAERDNP